MSDSCFLVLVRGGRRTGGPRWFLYHICNSAVKHIYNFLQSLILSFKMMMIIIVIELMTEFVSSSSLKI